MPGTLARIRIGKSGGSPIRSKPFDVTGAILVDENGIVLAGHARLRLQKSGFAMVPTIIVTDLTEAQKRIFVLADNKHAEGAG